MLDRPGLGLPLVSSASPLLGRSQGYIASFLAGHGYIDEAVRRAAETYKKRIAKIKQFAFSRLKS
jgi:hypothetical protein